MFSIRLLAIMVMVAMVAVGLAGVAQADEPFLSVGSPDPNLTGARWYDANGNQTATIADGCRFMEQVFRNGTLYVVRYPASDAPGEVISYSAATGNRTSDWTYDIWYPYGLAMTPNNDMYVISAYGRVHYSASTAAHPSPATLLFNTTSGSAGGARDAAVDADGNIWVVLNDANLVEKYSHNGDVLASYSVSGPYGIAISKAGDVYVTSSGNNKVLKLNGTEFVDYLTEGIEMPIDIEFGPGEWMYISCNSVDDDFDKIVRYNGTTLEDFISVTNPGFIAINAQEEITADTFLAVSTTIGRNGVTFYEKNGIKTTTQLRDIGDTERITGMAFKDNTLFASRFQSNEVLIFNGSTGARTGDWAYSCYNPMGLAVGLDGTLYIAADVSGFPIYSVPWVGAHPIAANIFTSASNGSRGIAVDPQGNIWAALPDANLVEKFSPAGARLASYAVNGPYGLAISPAGEVFVSCPADNKVVKFNGTGFADYITNGLSNPIGLACGPNSWLYIASHGADKVVRYDGTTLQDFASVNDPMWIAIKADMEPTVDAVPFIAVGSASQYGVKWYERNGKKTVAQPEYVGNNRVLGMAFRDNTFYSSRFESGDVLSHNATTGTRTSDWAFAAYNPMGLALDSDGNMYIAADFDAYPIYYSPWNIEHPQPPSVFVNASNGSRGIAVDADDNIWVVLPDLSMVEKYAHDGSLLDIYFVWEPYGITISPAGEVFVTCPSSNKVVKFDGTIFADYITSGLSRPMGLAYGPDSRLYISCNASNKIVRYDGTTLEDFMTVLDPLAIAINPAGYIPQAQDMSISDAKTASDGTNVKITGYVTAVFQSAGMIYIETQDRSSGIRVNTTKSVPLNAKVQVTGSIMTLGTSERYVDAFDVSELGETIEIKPLGMNNKTVGGGDLNNDTAGQKGVTDGTGVNNIGLLIRTTGKANLESGTTYTLDDGSGVPIKAAFYTGTVPANAAYVAVTGISSLGTAGSDVIRTVLVTNWQPTTP